MTSTLTVTCPEWCEIHACTGEHRRHTQFHNYVPANGSLTPASGPQQPRQVPQLGTGIYWDESWGSGIRIVLHEHVADTEFQLDLPDALALASRILTECALATDPLAQISITGGRMEWSNFKAATAAIIDKYGRP